MRRRVALMLALLSVAGLSRAAGRDEVPLVAQITAGQRASLPDKTISVGVKKVKFSKKADPDFIRALEDLMREVAEADMFNYLYVVALTPGQGDTIGVSIVSEDILQHAFRDNVLFGTMLLERRHFVFVCQAGGERMLKLLLDSAGGKTTFVREFEMVECVVTPEQAVMDAVWTRRGMDVRSFHANGVDQLERREK